MEIFMKRIIALLLVLSMSALLLLSCSNDDNNPWSPDGSLGSDDTTFGEELDKIGVYDGYFEAESTEVVVQYISGTEGAYSLEGTTLTFSGISEDSVYSVTGKLCGNIVIDVPDELKLELELVGFSIVSTDINPIQIISGDKVIITAKRDTENYIYDMREATDDGEETVTSGAIHSEVDLRVGGKGSLTVYSEYNNGIHTKDDLEVKNLTLTVACEDNALKGNDSVEITNGTVTLISTVGDGIKTTNSDISDKGNQRGSVTLTDTNVTIYAACDGIDAAYNVVIDGADTKLNIYTDKYSNYSKEVTAVSSNEYYIRFTSSAYKYSVKYYNSDSDCEWVNATSHSTASGGMRSYYYYSFPKKTEYSKMKVYIYTSDMEQGQDSEFAAEIGYITLSTEYDTFAMTLSGNYIYYDWTNYTTTVQSGMGGPGGGPGGGGFGGIDGNTDKGDHSTKGIKAANEIVVNNGTLNIKSYDDSLHADNSTTLENTETPLGNITINGGALTLYSCDDAIHAEDSVYIKGGNVGVVNSYEGIEGMKVFVSGGETSVYAKDDGVNSTATSGTGITLSGGYLYVYCTDDGLDTNSNTNYSGISFEGGNAVIIANSSGNSAIDTERGYKYTSGSIVAIMPRGGMTGEAAHCENFNSIGVTQSMTLTSGGTLKISGDMNVSITMPCSISNAYVVILNNSLNVSN